MGQGPSYNTEELFAKAMIAIEENKLFFIDDVISWLVCGRSTFYDRFRPNSDKLNAIKDALDRNRIQTKVSLRAKFYKSDSATEKIVLYKLIGTEEERRRLSSTEMRITGGMDNAPGIDLGRLTAEQRAMWYELYNLARIPENNTIDIDHEEINHKELSE